MKTHSIILIVVPSLLLVALTACKDNAVSPLTPQLSTHGILFGSNRDSPSSSQLFLMSSEARTARRITFPDDSITYLCAVWSPDMTKLAVVWDYFDLRHGEYPFLSLADSSGVIVTQISLFCNAASPRWSPDGSRIAYSKPANYFGGTSDIYIADINAPSTPTKVTHFQNTQSKYSSAILLDWKTPATLLVRIQTDSVYQDAAGRSNFQTSIGIYELDLEGNLQRSVFNDSLTSYLTALLSPDASRLAFIYNDKAGHTGVGIANTDGTNPTKIAPEIPYNLSQGWYTSLSWSPDNKHLCFSSDITPSFHPIGGQLYSYDVEEGSLQILINDSEHTTNVMDWR